MRILLPILFFSLSSICQTLNSNELTYNEYLGYVKKFHPLVKSANLQVSSAQAGLLMARGGFDPKIEVDFDKKQFKNTEYYSLLNTAFKIPTWYGIDIKAGFDNSDGVYLNPQNNLPNNGLTSLGMEIPLGQGLLINQRMADLRKAKIQLQLSDAERQLQAIEVVYDASLAYFNWKRNYSEVKLYQNFLQNASVRFDATISLINNGDKPAIDSVEAKIVVRNRQLNLENALLKLAKAKLELSNFLWLDNSIPLELQDNVIPEENLVLTIGSTLNTDSALLANPSLDNHPKINSLLSKIAIFEVDRKLKANALLPKLGVGYYYLSEPNYWDDTNFDNYKIGLNFSFPLFLRKERGSLQLAKFKIQDSRYALDVERLQIKNKISTQQIEINSLEKQRKLITELVADYTMMLNSEERLFSFGESSLFLINSRENNLVTAQISDIEMQNRYFISSVQLYRTIANFN